METALQELIRELNEESEALEIGIQGCLTPSLLIVFKAKRNQLDNIKERIIAKLPKEREQIEKAYNSGNEKSWSAASKITSQEYYETNFNK
jgi:hypothetical protein